MQVVLQCGVQQATGLFFGEIREKTAQSWYSTVLSAAALSVWRGQEAGQTVGFERSDKISQYLSADSVHEAPTPSQAVTSFGSTENLPFLKPRLSSSQRHPEQLRPPLPHTLQPELWST